MPAASSKASVRVLVDGRFDGSRRIEHGHAGRRDSVQGVHPEDDLLQTPRRHHPHQHAIDGGQVDARRRVTSDARVLRGPSDNRRRRPGNGTARNDTPIRPAARSRSATCQPNPETRATSDVMDVDSGFQILVVISRRFTAISDSLAISRRTNGPARLVRCARRHASCPSRRSGTRPRRG